MTDSRASHKRRNVLKSIGGLALGSSALVGTAVGKQPTNLREKQQFYAVNPAGTRDQPFNYAFQSERPLRMETNTGGVVYSRPKKNGFSTKVDLTRQDAVGGATVYFENIDLGEIGTIKVETTDEIVFSCYLGVEFNNNTFFEWEELPGNKRKFDNYDGDARTLAGYIKPENGVVTIDSDEDIFLLFYPDKGPIGLLSLNDLRNRFDNNIPVGIGVGVLGGPNFSSQNEALITDFAIETR